MGNDNGGSVFNLTSGSVPSISPASMNPMLMDPEFHMRTDAVRTLAGKVVEKGAPLDHLLDKLEARRHEGGSTDLEIYTFGLIGGGLKAAHTSAREVAIEALKAGKSALESWNTALTQAADNVDQAEKESSPDRKDIPQIDPSDFNGKTPNLDMSKLNPSGLDPNKLGPGGRTPDMLNPDGLRPDVPNPNVSNPDGLQPNVPNPGGSQPNVPNLDDLTPNTPGLNGVNPNAPGLNGLTPNTPNLNGIGDPAGTSLANTDPNALRPPAVTDPRLTDPNALGNLNALGNSGTRGGAGSPYGTIPYGSGAIPYRGGGGPGGVGGPAGMSRGLGANAGMPFMPFAPMAGAGGAGDKEREREAGASLPEDESTWLGDEEVAPPVIGMEES